MSEWQPIETAPHGEELLLFFPAIVNRYGQRTHVPMTKVDRFPVHYPRPPTHWMPLPPPPAERSQP